MTKKTTSTVTTTTKIANENVLETSLFNVKPVFMACGKKADTCNTLSVGFSGKVTGKSIKDEARNVWPSMDGNISLNEISHKTSQMKILKNAIAYATGERIFIERAKSTKAVDKTDAARFDCSLERKTWETKAHMSHVLAIEEFNKLCLADELNQGRAFSSLYDTYVSYMKGEKSSDDLFTEAYKYYSLFGIQLTNKSKTEIVKISGMKAKSGDMTEMAVVSKLQYLKDTTSYFFTTVYNAVVENNLKNDLMKLVVSKVREIIGMDTYIVVLPKDTMKTLSHVKEYTDSVLGTTINAGKGDSLRKAKAISVCRYDREVYTPTF